MRVVIVGPGRIGCGYLAPLFSAAGWQVVFGTSTQAIAARIRRSRSFNVRITGNGSAPPTSIHGADAAAVDSEDFRAAVARADLVCTAVGVGNVTALGSPLARALARRSSTAPIDVWVVENADAAGGLRDAVTSEARSLNLVLPPVGYAGAVAKVAVARGSWRNERHPEFVTDSARELFVDAGALGTAPPSLPGVGVTNDYVARLREKLFVFNAAHSICAFLGWLRGHKTIDRAVLDPFLRPMIIGCLLESRSAVLASHPKLGHDLHGPVEEALRRFANSALADPVDRVGRDPIRKLGPRDRLLGPVDLIRRVNGRVPPYFALGVAGALLFRPDGDGQACELRTTLGCEGVMSVLRHICGLEPDDPFTQAVAGRYRNFIFTPEGTIFPPAHASVPAWSAGARIVEATG